MKYVEFIEPYLDIKDAYAIVRVPVEHAIKTQKFLAVHNHTYESDQEALDDFVIIHWGRVIELNEHRTDGENGGDDGDNYHVGDVGGTHGGQEE